MDINLIFSPDCIFFDRPFATKGEVFSFFADCFLRAGILTEKEPYLEALWYRESKGETGLERFVAMPHGMSKAVVRPAVGYVRLAQPIPWEAIEEDCQQAKYVFILAIPEGGSQEHLRILSLLASKLIRPDVIGHLDSITEAQQMLTLFSM